ncbi:MAG: hypothetical protein M3X11_25705 [Acidobacteriota bacterium]|nr:hypothetical protein [Acidobacteriota bacterium]
MVSKLDDELGRQLSAAALSGDAVEAVVRLHGQASGQLVPDPDQMKKTAQQVLDRVQQRVGYGEQRSHVFSNLGYFVVAADKSFIEELIAQPEVAAVVANRQPDPPKAKKN